VAVTCSGGAIEGGESRNVVATLPGTGDAWIVISSHFDTAPGVPGANDDASGTAIVLELARRMKDAKPAARVIFLLTGSEEYGDDTDGTGRGALEFYRRRVDELPSCVGHVDTDDLGKPLSVPKLSIAGPRPFREAILTDGLGERYLVRGRTGAGCDHGAAERHGVPYVWFNDTVGGNQPQLHTPADTIEFLDFRRMAAFVDDICAAAERLGALGPVSPFVESDGTLVRPARSTDLPRMLDITRRAFAEVSMDRMKQAFNGTPLGGREWHEHKKARVEAFYRAHPLWTVVAQTSGTLSGYATYTIDPTQSLAVLGDNAVDPEYQGRGIGSRLQKEVNRRIAEEGCAISEVATHSDNEAAQRIYEKHGYERYAVSYHYLARPRGTSSSPSH
jgi:ribosomal protein S18 acetylase RimI-like enzyme